MKYALLISMIFLTFCENFDDGIICTEQFVYGLNVIVKDAATEDILVEEVAVVAIEEGFEETLMNIPGSTNFVGAGERPGNYTIHVTSPNYQEFTSELIVVGADECHVIPEMVEIILEEN